MIRIDVGTAGVTVAERFDEHVLVRVVEDARPVEPQTSRFGAGRLGERSG